MEGLARAKRLAKLAVRRDFKEKEKDAYKSNYIKFVKDETVNTGRPIRKYPYNRKLKKLSSKRTAIGFRAVIFRRAKKRKGLKKKLKGK